MKKQAIGSVVLALVLGWSSSAFAKTAVASIMGTAPESTLSGTVMMTEADGGLDLVVLLDNVPPGKHGFHVHEIGACGDSGKAAGAHFNPDGHSHGSLYQEGLEGAHAGDLGNLQIGPSGGGTFKAFVAGLSLSEGKYNVAGRAVILHEKEDDFSQPAGNAGGRIGCGVIELTS